MLAGAKLGLTEESYLSSPVTRQRDNSNLSGICVAQRNAADAAATMMAARIGQGMAC